MKDIALPLISVVMCTYNGEKYIEEQLNSILKQTYQNLEIIIVDDVSTDNTWQILEQYQQKYKNISIYKNEKNLGYIKNFENALKKATGDLIAIADQDDIWLPQKLEIQQKNIEDNLIIYHDSALINQKGEYLNKNISSIINMYEGDNCRSLIFDNCISGHTILCKKELLSYIFPFPTDMFYDWWMGFIALAVGKIKYLPETFVKYRQHEQSVTDISGIKQKKNIPNNIKKQLEIINRNREYKEIMIKLKNYNSFHAYKNKEDKLLIENLINGFEQKKTKSFVPQLFWLLYKNRKIILFTRKKKPFKKFKIIFRIALIRKYNQIPNPKLAEEVAKYINK
jgi:glycosyltransferase involved in cell wall biosynthesis